MEIRAFTLLCYPNIFNVLLHVRVMYIYTKRIFILNKSTTTTIRNRDSNLTFSEMCNRN